MARTYFSVVQPLVVESAVKRHAVVSPLVV
jgi:hypothetical protein